jgi:hypothetical protein
MKDEIILYQANQASTRIEVRIYNDTVWLNIEEISYLFDRDRTVINRHINNIFKEEELNKEVVCAFFAHTTQHGAMKGIFFDGQIFDAYVFVSEIIKNAKTEIILIDNYIDETVLIQLSKRNNDVSAAIYTCKISHQLQLDIDKHNQQYPKIKIKQLSNCHDRFLIIDRTELYHLGASLKNLGKKWFAFSRMDSLTESLLNMLTD